MRYTWIALVAAAFLAACGTVEAAASDTPAATAPPAAPAATLTPAEHYAKGELLYDKEWVPIDKLFREYLESRHELDRAGKRSDDVQGRLENLQRELAQVKGEVSETERPVRAELSKARNKLRDYSRILAKKPPAKPQLKEIPPAPATSSYNSGNNRGDTRYGTGSSYNNNDDRRRAWRERADAIKRENDQALKKYQLELTEYQREQNEAKAEAPKLQATIKECEEKLKALGAELDAKQAPTLNRTNATTEEARDYNRRIEAIETRVENMMKALRAAPETLRYTHNIVEWEKQFYTVAELQEMYTTTQTEIDKVHEQLKAESEKAGLPFPENWRHPQQDRMDAIKALIVKVKAVKEAAAKEAAAKAAAAKTAKG